LNREKRILLVAFSRRRVDVRGGDFRAKNAALVMTAFSLKVFCKPLKNLYWGEAAGKKKGSSFGTTAAASRGVFYEWAQFSISYWEVYT
jgi:hypothetical protein